MGSELYQAGLEPEECAVEWNLSRPERVRAIHQSYFDAGARCLLTNTFQANPCALVLHELEERLYDIHTSALKIANDVSQGQAMILASVGPICIQGLDQEFPEWEELKETVRSLLEASERNSLQLDGILLETCSTERALSASGYLRQFVLPEEMPLYLSIAYERQSGGEIFSHGGQRPETFAKHAHSHGVDAIGVNCGRDIDLDTMLDIVKRYRTVTELPIFARPNAGTPQRVENQWSYPLSPDEFADRVIDFVEAGVSMIGGCCGTTTAHISAVSQQIEHWQSSTQL